MPPLIPGRYYTVPQTGNTTTSSSVTGPRLVVIPFYVPHSTNLDTLSVDRTGATNVNATLGIYGPFTGDLVGCPLLLTTSQFAMLVNGDYPQTISITLAPGWYLLAVAYDANWNTTQLPTADHIGMLGLDSLASAGGNIHARWSGNFQPLPATLPVNPTYGISGTPVIYYRAA